tara:strand:- start:19 stop:459 length:441 start_codon:yes stop_codon:yes gene_type:complete
MPHKDKEERTKYQREYRQKNKEKIAEYNQNNKDKIAERQREYNQNNKEQIAEHAREYHKIYNQTPAGKKTLTMSRWRWRGVINVNDEMYNHYIATTRCECCLKEFSSSRDRCLDHEHKTGEFRWVICQACNNMDNWKNKISTHQGC